MAKSIKDKVLINKIRKPRTHKGKRFLAKREPQLVEDVKKVAFCRCSTADQKCVQLLKNLYLLKKPNAVYLNRKETWRPFEDVSKLEFVVEKNDCALFAYGSHSKKRPHNLIIGRTFDGRVLDMVELHFENFMSLSDFHISKIPTGTKPLILFTGELFDTSPDYQRLKSLFLDFFVGPDVDRINLTGFEHVIHFIENEQTIYMRSYRIYLKKSGVSQPRVEVDEIGPRVDFTLKRTSFASSDLFKKALKKPIEILKQQGQKRKIEERNISKDELGSTLGRIHMERQDYSKLKLKKGKAFKAKVAKMESVPIP